MIGAVFKFLAGLFGRAAASEPSSASAERPAASVSGAPLAPADSATTTLVVPQVQQPVPTALASAPVPPAPAKPAPAVPAVSGSPDKMTPAQFIAAIAPAAQICAAKTRVPASVTIAQAALESSWGARAPGMNLFGIKADASWRGPISSVPTHEVIGGKSIEIVASFRAYSDWQGSIDDHAAFLVNNPRYRPAFASKSGVEFADAIAKAGYATDPQYADKLKSIITGRKLDAFDAAPVAA